MPMPLRYLFGPVTAHFADQNLREARASGACLTFNDVGDTDLRVGPGDRWEDVAARCPAGWQPDCVALNLAYTTVPEGLWSAPAPLIGLAGDWNLLFHHYRRCLARSDLVLTDSQGVEVLSRDGVAHARQANILGCERAYLETEWPDGPRDIDVLFVGNLNHAVQRERMPWVARLAALGDRWRVVIETGVFGADYRALLARSRVVFNRSIRGERDPCAFESAAAGRCSSTKPATARFRLSSRIGASTFVTPTTTWKSCWDTTWNTRTSAGPLPWRRSGG